MNMPKDTKGAAPEDVEAHSRLSRDTSEDVEAHGRYASDSLGIEQHDSGEDVEAHRRHFFDTDQADTDEDVEAHGTQRPRPEDGDDPELPRLR